MTSPVTVQQIRKKSARLFTRAMTACLAGDLDFFPYRLPVQLGSPSDPAELVRWNSELSSAAKTEKRAGYRIDRKRIKKRRTGENDYPVGIYFDSVDDVASVAGKLDELRQVRWMAARMHEELPQLDEWMEANWAQVLKAEEDLESLIVVVKFMIKSPRPGCYVRELPIPVSTKLVQRNLSLLEKWLDIVLLPEHIDYSRPRDFEARFGFRKPVEHCLMRVLDRQLVTEMGLPFDELSLPPKTASQLNVVGATVLVVENKISLLALPARERMIALGGYGDNLSVYQRIQWMAANQLVYWGDIDVEGLRTLSRFRRMFPLASSFQMDIETLLENHELCVPGKAKQFACPPCLTESERAAYELCRDQNLRLEQERLAFPGIRARL